MKSFFKVAIVCCLYATLMGISVEAHKQGETAPPAEANSALTDLKCPKCEKHMELGFLLEDQGSSAQTDTKWVQGPLTRKHFPFGYIENKGQRRVDAYRCINCGYLELYAR